MSGRALEGRGGVIPWWPHEVEQWRRDREEAEREHGPECMGCGSACDGCPEGNSHEPAALSEPLPELPAAIDTRSFRSYQPVGVDDDAPF